MSNLDVALDSIRAFGKKIDYPQIAALPTHVYGMEGGIHAPAYTNVNGIFIREDVIQDEPQNAAIYFAHEIGHHVVADNTLTAHFKSRLVSYAEDYKINLFIHKQFGYDVRKVKHPGIYSTRYGKMPLNIACQAILDDEGVDHAITRCWCFGVSHPLLIQAAHHIRQKFKINNHDRSIVITDKMDDQQFMRNLPMIRKCIMTPELPINMFETLKGMWLSAKGEVTPTPMTPGKLTLDQALVHTWEYIVKDDEYHANLATAVYFTTLARIRQELTKSLNTHFRSKAHAEGKLNKVKAAIAQRWSHGKKVTKVMWKEQTAWEEKIKTAQRLVRKDENLLKLPGLPLTFYQKKYPLILRTRPVVHTASIKQRLIKKKPVRVATSRTKLTKFIRWLNVRANRRLAVLIDLEDIFKNMLQQIIDEEEEQEEQSENERPETDIPDGDGEQENDLDDNSGGTGAGKGERVRQKRVETLLSLSDEDIMSLRNIMALMAEFESALSNNHAKVQDEFSHDPTTVSSVGNDLANIDAEELALLGNDNLQLLFLSRYADSTLSIQTPIIAKRNFVAICIDCSGSMRPKPYETACGFALAMMKKLHNEGRGSALIIFHDSLECEIVVDEKKPMMFTDILEALVTSRSGGTSFDPPLLTAYRIKKERRIQSLTTIVITDGQASLSEEATAIVHAEKTPADNITLGLIGGSSQSGFQGIEDDVFYLKKDGMKIELTKIGNRVL